MSVKLIFIEEFSALKEKLSPIGGEWDESQPTKKVLRLNGGIMNWFESTGTLQFQGKDTPRDALEALVKHQLYPNQDNPVPSANLTSQADASTTKPLKIESVLEQRVSSYLKGELEDSELMLGIVSSVGTESARVITPLTDRIKRYGFEVESIRVSDLLSAGQNKQIPEYQRIKALMAAGDTLRETSGRNSILAAGVAAKIKEQRRGRNGKVAYIINSLKHPDEVELLRRIYGQAFYMIGIHSDEKRRLSYLKNDKGLTNEEATELTRIDEDEDLKHGQRTRDTFHLSDFFINLGRNDDQVKNTLARFLELIFSHPYKNPTFDEFAMFMAFCSSIRSGDLSRQVGAIVARDRQIIATGANECPTFKGGQYWAEVDAQTGEVNDRPEGKDYTWEGDSNKEEQRQIIRQIVDKAAGISGVSAEITFSLEEVLRKSRIKDLTEFGRVVHAEMDALMSCARSGIATRDATLYCTTFPCHNCAKHIVAAGVVRVVYVEPYPKSKALDLHDDSIQLRTQLEETETPTKVMFEPFTGVGARRFLDLFSMSLGAGSKLKRKEEEGGATLEWKQETARVRIPVLPSSYRDAENEAEALFGSHMKSC